MRMSKDEYYLNIAKAVLQRSTCLKRKYGCVIVKDDVIVATGYNGSPRGEVNCCDSGKCKRLNIPHNSGDYSICKAVHAEQNAIISASRKDLIDSTVYLYCEENNEPIAAEPCPICRNMLVNAKVKNIISIAGNIKF